MKLEPASGQPINSCRRVTISPERPDSADAQALIAELQTSLAALYPAENQFGYSVEKLIRDEVAFYVVRVDGAPAGCGGVQIFGATYGEVKRMYVRPQFRGQKLGNVILAQLEDYARARNVPLLRLETGTLQHAAIRLYTEYGFYRTGAFGQYPETDWNIYYEKKISLRLDEIK